MPKTRKKRKGNGSKKGKTSKEKASSDSVKASEVTPEPDLNTTVKSQDIVDFDSLSESDLKVELQTELKRLQDEYKRQKELTQEMEQERAKLQSAPSTAGAGGIPTRVSPAPEYKPTEYPEEYFEPRFDQPYLSEPDIEERVMDSVTGLKTELSEIKEKLETKMDLDGIKDIQLDQDLTGELSKSIDEFRKELQRMQKEVAKTDQKLSSILLDLGFEESVDINKIPNYILVLVYEKILNDIIVKIQHTMGTQDTETAVINTLEKIRTHTSGGELFKYEHTKIKIPELRQYLDKKTISPKQIHITFNSIIKQLLEYIPGYSPKNFKAMIKIMSQEYAVDTVAKLDNRLDWLESQLIGMKKDVNKILDESTKSEPEQTGLDEEFKKINDRIVELTTHFDGLPDIIENKLNDKLAELSLPAAKSIDEPVTPSPGTAEETVEKAEDVAEAEEPPAEAAVEPKVEEEVASEIEEPSKKDSDDAQAVEAKGWAELTKEIEEAMNKGITEDEPTEIPESTESIPAEPDQELEKDAEVEVEAEIEAEVKKPKKEKTKKSKKKGKKKDE